MARQVRRNQESFKLLILTPHNDTVDDILAVASLLTTFLPSCTNSTSLWSTSNNFFPQALHQDLERRTTIETIVQIAFDFLKGSYCTISNTVKAIGIRGVASVFVSCKISDFLTQSQNLVALTRSAAKTHAFSSFLVLTVSHFLRCCSSVTSRETNGRRYPEQW